MCNIILHYSFLPRVKNNLCFLVKRNWKSDVSCSVGWLEVKQISISLDVGYFSVSISIPREVLCVRKYKKQILASFFLRGTEF